MITNTQNIEEIIKFYPESGRIHLNNKRMILMEADAYGTLRRDLIASLGIDRAKGFLLRHGWSNGINVAKQLKEIFPFDSEIDWLSAGGYVHGMTGYVSVEVKELKYDPATKEYYSECYWYDSVEAEQHVKQFGNHHEPVCFNLVGTAGGYVSTHVGRKIIFKEIECVGKGDLRCRLIGKSIEDWGEDIETELHYYEEENLAQELDRAFLRIEKQKEIFKRALKINEKLSKVLLAGGGLQSVVKVLGEELNHTVIIEDKNFNRLESNGGYKNHNFMEFIKFPKHDQTLRKRMNQVINEKRTVHITVPEQFGWQHERLISPIVIKNEILGYISFLKESGRYDEMEYISLERASTICAIQLLNERTAIETIQQIKGEFLNELIRGSYNEEEITYRIRILGYNLKQEYYVFLFNIEYNDELKGGEEYFIKVKKQISEMIDTEVRNFGEPCLMSTNLNQIVLLMPHEMIKRSKLEVNEFGQSILNSITNRFGNFNIMLGISSLCKQIKTLKKGFEEAEKAIEILKLKRSPLRVIFFGELGSIGKIFCSENLADLENHACELLNEIKAYDEQYNLELLKTLYYFIENQGNMQKTSRELNISMGAIRYRMKRIQEFSDLDLTNSQDFFDAHLAVQVYSFLGMMKFN
ncbi:XylR N-terminal domain-containing protein [Niallia oryzisoli]|uniref:XylR N-terminal domain-containing protein n=1 Tax=Niallia oryzisoli TaxID=1737571 RepID=A0ABZ2C894_9BACI